MSRTGENQSDGNVGQKSPSGNNIPVRSHYRSPKRIISATQPSIKSHAIRLAIASAIGIVLMLVLLMLAIQYAQRDWSRKNVRARTPPATAKIAPTPAMEETHGWTCTLRPSATRRHLQRLTEDPFLSNWWLLLARGLSDKSRPEIQLSGLRMAMAVGGETAEIRNDWGAFYLQHNRMRDASSQFAAADQILPGYPPARFNLALCAISDRNPARAIRLLGQYLGQRPSDITALRLQASLLSRLDRPLDALRMLEKFLKDQPPDQPLFLEASILAVRLGQNGNAIRYLETAMYGNPIQAVIRTYQSSAFRDIRLSGEGDPLAARLANRARIAFGAPIPVEDVQPLRATTPEAIVR